MTVGDLFIKCDVFKKEIEKHGLDITVGGKTAIYCKNKAMDAIEKYSECKIINMWYAANGVISISAEEKADPKPDELYAPAEPAKSQAAASAGRGEPVRPMTRKLLEEADAIECEHVRTDHYNATILDDFLPRLEETGIIGGEDRVFLQQIIRYGEMFGCYLEEQVELIMAKFLLIGVEDGVPSKAFEAAAEAARKEKTA